ncbi:MAG: 2-hydroxyacyl-CoA dehydratase, partial [Candidatus Tectomicrobia bacterium]|nr:2-hydroxyacyl-CoA dehydratase [Candidatus Tectomicrobia bacterium]
MSTQEQRVKTSKSKKSIQTATETWAFIKEDYANGHQGKAEGRPIAWSCAAMDKELFHCMGVQPFFPEQFAALSAVQRRGGTRDESVEKEAVRFARAAEQEDYASYLCGYQRVATGFVIESLRTGEWHDAPLRGMPKPDMIVTTSCVCDVRVKWFEDMAQRLNVPYFCMDRPERIFKGILSTPKEHEVDYYASQIEDCLEFIAEVTGTKYDPARLNECLDWAYKTNNVRQEILQLRKSVPSPMGCADGFGTMYPGMYQSGTRRCYDFYAKMRDELRERVQKGIGQIENERFRLLWYGLPTWYN